MEETLKILDNILKASEKTLKKLIGKKLVSVGTVSDYKLIFTTDCGLKYAFICNDLKHRYVQRSSPTILKINGELGDLILSPIISATETVHFSHRDDHNHTYIIQRIVNKDCEVTICWHGQRESQLYPARVYLEELSECDFLY